MTLQLFGTAIRCTGFDEKCDRSVLRLRGPNDSPGQTTSDFALVRTPEDFGRAKDRNWQSFFVVGEELSDSVRELNGRAIVVSPQFNYLARGRHRWPSTPRWAISNALSQEFKAQFLFSYRKVQQLLSYVLPAAEGC